MRLVARDGVSAATTRRIAAEAGITPGIVHYVYGSLEELLRDVALAATQELIDAVDLSPSPEGDLKQILRGALDSIWHIVESRPDAQLALYELTTYCLRNPGTVDVAAQQYQGYQQACRAYLTAIEESCQVRFDADPDVLARLLMTILDGGMLAWLADRDTAATFGAFDLFAAYLAGLAVPSART